MKASILDLRRRMAEVLRALDRSEAVKILHRGRERAVLVPGGSAGEDSAPVERHPAFGMWKDRKDMQNVAAHVRKLREGRFGAS